MPRSLRKTNAAAHWPCSAASWSSSVDRVVLQQLHRHRLVAGRQRLDAVRHRSRADPAGRGDRRRRRSGPSGHGRRGGRHDGRTAPALPGLECPLRKLGVCLGAGSGRGRPRARSQRFALRPAQPREGRDADGRRIRPIFVIGLWFFETLFQTNEAPFTLGDNWPVAAIVVGGVLLVAGLLRRTSPEAGGESV